MTRRRWYFIAMPGGLERRLRPIAAFVNQPSDAIRKAVADRYRSPVAVVSAPGLRMAMTLAANQVLRDHHRRRNPTMVDQGLAVRPTFHVLDAFGKPVADSYVNLQLTKAMAQAAANAGGYSVSVKPFAGSGLHAARVVKEITTARARTRNPRRKRPTTHREAFAQLLEAGGFKTLARDVRAGLPVDAALAVAERAARPGDAPKYRRARELAKRATNPKGGRGAKRLSWDTFAGGTGAWEGASSYSTRSSPWGTYYVQPFTTVNGRRGGYLVRFAADAGEPIPAGGVMHSGLWHDLGRASSPAAGKKAAREHYERMVELAGGAPPSKRAAPNPGARRRRARSL